MVIGSVIPDLGYGFRDQHVQEFSHSVLGSFGFCLPAGLFCYGLLRWRLRPTVRLLREDQRRVLLPLGPEESGPLWAIVLSLFAGASTHLVWDAFTHRDGWFVQNLLLLHYEFGSLGGHHLRVCHFLWYGSSFAGEACVFVAYRRWRQGLAAVATVNPGKSPWIGGIAVAMLMVPIELIHHLARGWIVGTVLVAVVSGLLVVVVVWSDLR